MSQNRQLAREREVKTESGRKGHRGRTHSEVLRTAERSCPGSYQRQPGLLIDLCTGSVLQAFLTHTEDLQQEAAREALTCKCMNVKFCFVYWRGDAGLKSAAVQINPGRLC